MLSMTREGVGAAPGQAAAEPLEERPKNGCGGGQLSGVLECHDGSRYEGEFVNGLKHGNGRYTWRNGEVTSQRKINSSRS